jgi:hypothetical protein
MQPEFIIFAPKYDERNGGSIVLHHLCHLINQLGGKASIVPFFESRLISPLTKQKGVGTRLARLFAGKGFRRRAQFLTNPHLSTPIFNDIRSIAARDDIVTVYPEIVAGNPLNARHVARWLLHEPGFHTGQIFFTRGEVQFRFSDRFQAVQAPGLEIATGFLDIFVIPWELYAAEPGIDRQGIAYAIRKGKGKALVHDPEGAILIDPMKPAEVARTLKSVKTFISYDSHTMYSAFAVIAGCDSVVIPDPGVSIEAWSPDPSGRLGIAYGFDDLPRARATRDELIAVLRKRETENLRSVAAFVEFWNKRHAKLRAQ